MLHLACRCQVATVVHFLISHADLPVAVQDDYGRTPLHDALWTAQPPNFVVVDLVLRKCPDLLLVADVRGHLPLCYAPAPAAAVWLQHFGRHLERYLPAASSSSSSWRALSESSESSGPDLSDCTAAATLQGSTLGLGNAPKF